MANQANNINMTINLEKMTIPQLKQLCRDNNYKGFSLQKKKADLILFIKNKQQENQDKVPEEKVAEIPQTKVPEVKDEKVAEIPQTEVPEVKAEKVAETYEPTINFFNYKSDNCQGLIKEFKNDRLFSISILVNKQKLKKKYNDILAGRRIKYIFAYNHSNPNFVNKKNTEIEFTEWCACRPNDDGAETRNIKTFSYPAYKNPLGDCFVIYF